MSVFSSKYFRGHQDIRFHHDSKSGLKAIIAIHDTTLGPAVGGCRMWPYDNEAAAIDDALRLSRGMTYKNAMAQLPFGGGKAVIIGDPETDKSNPLFEAMGAFVDGFQGRFRIGEDMGISPADVEIMRRRTRHVAGIAEGSAGNGDPSPATAWGVYHGILAAIRWRLERNDCQGLKVAVQGIGHVGWHLLDLLYMAGARLVVSDLNKTLLARAKAEFDVEVVAPDEIFSAEVDVFAPCAMGAVLNSETIPQIKAKIIAGSANNQLAQDRDGRLLYARDILYAPDYVINAGGIIHIFHEGPNYDRQQAYEHCARIGATLTDIFAIAQTEKCPTHEIADHLAEDRLTAGRLAAARLEAAKSKAGGKNSNVEALFKAS